MELQELRRELDLLDAEIVRFFAKRMAICGEVAENKRKSGKAVLDAKREEEKLQAVSELVSDPFLKKGVRELFSELMALSRRWQLEKLMDRDEDGIAAFQEIPDFPRDGQRIVYQGVPGAYQEIAARACFSESCRFQGVKSFREAMTLTREGEADFSVLPVENSSYGVVADTLDLLTEFPDLTILQEIQLPIEHALLVRPGTGLERIRTVYSHAQAIGQCQSFFREHPEMTAVAVGNTALAAKRVAEAGEEGTAAIGSRRAGELYGLETVLFPLNRERGNTTRFFVLGKQSCFRKAAAKLSILFETRHQPGALYQALGSLFFHDVNMIHISSRPIPERPFEYRFFADLAGNLKEEKVRAALSALRGQSEAFRILGCY